MIVSKIGDIKVLALVDLGNRQPQNGQPFESWEEFESWFRQERPKHAQVVSYCELLLLL